MRNEEYRRTRIFEKADHAYGVAKFFLCLFWMPILVGIVLYLLLS